jgi:hypothetical protein
MADRFHSQLVNVNKLAGCFIVVIVVVVVITTSNLVWSLS